MNDIATTSRVTVPFEARDLLSGAIRQMRTLLQGASDDLSEFRRRSGSMFDDFVSSSRRARESVDDFGRRINSTRDDLLRFGRTQVDDPFRRARAGADDLRRAADRADSEIKDLSDAHVRLRADDEISPLIDNISGKIAALAAAAGGIVIGGGIADTMFGGVMDYSREAARSAPYAPASVRAETLTDNDQLYTRAIVSDRAAGAANLADLAPMITDKSMLNEAFSASAKIQFIRPDSGGEEINRVLAQASNVYKETPMQIADSIMYAYKEVGDRQQDLLDTFWEYSGYFKNVNVDSSQTSNFLVKSVQEGAFNFDKPADFFKEVFGVKALNTGDMAAYFEHRGSGKDEAQRQAQTFTADINSGDKQRTQGAIAALIADLASQSRSQLKESLVQLGSGAGEDNADSILKTYGVAFQKAPDMAGTTDQLVGEIQAADPMTPIRQTQAEISLQLQNIGMNITTAALPALKEFNALLVENKDEIQALGTGITSAVTTAVGFYKDNMTAINTALMGLAAVLVVKGITSFAKGVKQLNDDLSSAAKWVGDKGQTALNVTGRGVKTGWNWLRGNSSQPPEPTEETPAQRSARIRAQLGNRGIRRQWGRNTNPLGDAVGGLRGAASMTVNASTVYVNGNVVGSGGGPDRGRRGGGRRGGVRRGRIGSGGPGNPPNPNPPLGSRENPLRGRRPTPPDPTPDPPRGGGFRGALSKVGKVAKVGGIVGTVASVAGGAYSLYEASKEQGWREAASTQGGAVVGGIAGGAIGGAVGSVLGPLGTMAGAYIGNVVGEKIGKLADESGATRWVVDHAVTAFEGAKSAFGMAADWITGKKEEKPAPPPPPPEAKITISNITPEKQERMEEIYKDFTDDFVNKGVSEAFKGVMNQPEVKEVTDGVEKLFGTVTSVFNHVNTDKAQQEIKEVAAATQTAKTQSDQFGQSISSSANEIVSGMNQASQSMSNVSAAAGTAAAETRQHLQTIQNVTSQGSSWGSNLIDMIVGGIRSKFPSLANVVSEAAGVISKYLGFHSPTEEGPASDSDKWAGNFVSMFAGGLSADPIRQRMRLIAGTMRQGVQGIEGPNGLSSGSSIPMAQTLNMSPSKTPGTVTIGNINIDFGEMAKGITDFAQFAQMLSSPEGRALIRRVFGEELYKVLETGG